jgi:hypothetical protein
VQALQQLQQLFRDTQNLMQSQKNFCRVQTAEQDVGLALADEVKVRSARPGPAFDDKGNIKHYTREELKELKGSDPRLPGFHAALSDLQAGQVVLLKVARPTSIDAKPRPGGVKPVPVSAKLIVTMILIVTDSMQ